MSAPEMIFRIILWILAIAAMLGIIGMLPAIVVGIVILVKRSDEVYLKKKKSLLKKFILFPGVLLVSSLILYAIVKMIETLIFGF